MRSRFTRRAALLMAAVAVAVGTGLLHAAEPDATVLERGRTLWMTAAGIGCAGCHGRFGEGDVGIGPYNRGVGLSKIQSSIAAVDQMRVIKQAVSAQDIEAIAAYNTWLGQHQLLKTLVKMDRFVPNALEIYPGTAVQMVINNGSQAAHTFASADMKLSDVQVPGRALYDFTWQAPPQEGVYVLKCADCSGADHDLTIKVTRNAKPYRLPGS